ncbi:hypothetical protein B0A50_00904 [Salinomyces thailandicus]|uniref:STB6-like N-terminal domain-containing protein n=1 Tax=Salinomyces thailandicus TaxID=706561 RepID=A0A4U0UCW0_9PEZI|nr:hypothetical protein B0A50_00904 [Salinomyces thailandica]
MAGRASTDDRRTRPPRLDTNVHRPSTAPHTGTPSGSRHVTPPTQLETTPELDSEIGVESKAPRDPKPEYQGFVLTDPVAFRYLEEDPCTTVLQRRAELPGYECYIVEQWATSRTHPTPVITTYSGDPTHVLVVGVLNVPTDETTWSSRLRVYFKALNQYHARRRQTELGVLMVTNLSGFPSSLTVIGVPDGDLKKHRFDFVVNENLKRLGCSGRVSLSLTPPSAATVAKFHQLYRTSDKNELYKSVIELVKLCQSALMLFDKLEIDYADGLLCDVTERAINDWWVNIGSEHYNMEPHDGILGPTTVSGLLGLLMGARNRLHAYSAPVSKDSFDVEAMKKGVSYFQKQQRMPRTRRLDRRTLDRLHKATQKAAEHEAWTMPKVLKNTAAELSGKGGEMVMDAVGRRDKASISEIETCDIERFTQLLYGDRAKWLWLAKPMKKSHPHPKQDHMGAGEGPGLNRNLVFKPDDQGGFAWKARNQNGEGVGAEGRHAYGDGESVQGLDEGPTDDDEPRLGIFKRATGFKNEAKSGLGKFKGAVGLKSHHQTKHSFDDSPTPPNEDSGTTSRRPFFGQSSPMSSPSSPKSPEQEHKLDAAVAQQRGQERTDPEQTTQRNKMQDGKEPSSGAEPDASQESLDNQEAGDDTASESDLTAVTMEPSVAGSIYNGVELNEVLPTGPETEKGVSRHLQRTVSYSQYVTAQLQQRSDDAYPRHLSFSLAEDSVLTWKTLIEDDTQGHYNDAKAQSASQDLIAKQAKTLRLAINTLSTDTVEWTQRQLDTIQNFLHQLDRDQEYLDDRVQNPYLEHVNYIQEHSEGVLREQRERLEEGGREIETLASKLEYEIEGLRGRIEDAGAGMNDFQKGVGRVEERVAELEREGEGEGWLARCAVM